MSNQTKAGFWLLLPALCLSLAGFPQKSTLTYHRTITYPESDLIARFSWTGEPYKYPGTGSDMHWWTLGIDNALYVVDDDGSNFGGPANYAHLLKITGIPPAHRVETVTDFMEIPFRKMLPTPLIRRYVNGPIAIDSTLYIAIYDYDWHLDRIMPYRDSVALRTNQYMYNQRVKDPAMLQAMYFTDSYSRHYGTAGLIKSTDFGKTWTNIPDSTTPQFLGPKFAGLCFLNFGPGYTDVPPELGSYVYAVSNDGSWESGDHVFMARVHRDSLLVRSAWQFLSGFGKNGQPRWSKQEDASIPIFTDLGHVGHPTMSYNKPLKRYIMAIYSDVVPHRELTSIAEWKTWDQSSELQLYESKNPWGPWRIFHNEKQFGGENHTAYLPQLPNNWWNSTGLESTIMFAGDYTKGGGGYYALMTRPFKLTLKKPTAHSRNPAR
ncbi:MAG: DUF4185 domain-containing protein [Cytophagales bacterium]|nr:MAG: DUF4185 domain-containing protein [Cytophagales bacterium]